MKLLNFLKRCYSGQYKHKWRIFIPSNKYTIINNIQYICEKCNTTSATQFSGNSCSMSDNEYIIKNIIE